MVNDAEEYKRQDEEKFKNVEVTEIHLNPIFIIQESSLTDEIRGKMTEEEYGGN